MRHYYDPDEYEPFDRDEPEEPPTAAEVEADKIADCQEADEARGMYDAEVDR